MIRMGSFGSSHLKRASARTLASGQSDQAARLKTQVIAAEVAGGQAARATQHGGHGSASQREHGPDGERKHPLEGRLRESYTKAHQERLRCRWKRKHPGLLSDSLTSYISQNRQESAFCANNSPSIDSPKKRQKSSY